MQCNVSGRFGSVMGLYQVIPTQSVILMIGRQLPLIKWHAIKGTDQLLFIHPLFILHSLNHPFKFVNTFNNRFIHYFI